MAPASTQAYARPWRKQAEQQTRDEDLEHCQDGAALIAEAQALSAQHTDALVRSSPPCSACMQAMLAFAQAR